MNDQKTEFSRGDCGFEGNEPRRKDGETFEEIVSRRIDRRSLLKGTAAAAPLFTLGSIETLQGQAGDPTFTAITGNLDDSPTVPEGYQTRILARWGDPLSNAAPEFDADNLTAEAQRQQIGYNCDFLAWFDLPFGGIVGVNHEYTNPELMFSNYDSSNSSLEQVDYEIAAHGVSFFQVIPRRSPQGYQWEMVRNSTFNRRLHGETEMVITGPVAGHPLMKTSYDATGTMVRGTFNNCGGGVTPWRSYLTAEENFDQYFGNGDAVPNEMARTANARFGVRGEGGRRPWYQFQGRFDLSQEPNEINRFGWVVEVDPYDSTSTPKKRTALGRFKHEAAATTVSPSGRPVVYSGDDARFEYVYKFVADGTYNPSDRASNFDLLDSGTLYVARFDDDGKGEWLPLVYGQNGLTAINGFNSQAEVLMFARQAADILGATQMDRPEDIDINPVTGKVYVALTNNTRRTEEQVDAANPRASNAFGHIIEITELSGEHTATEFNWEIFILAGDPADTTHGAFFAGFDPAGVSKIANPDNLAFDRKGNLVIATDGQPRTVDINDGIFLCPTEGPNRGQNKQLFSGVVGAECASVIMNTTNTAMFISIQHPGEGGTKEEPISNFPDGPGVPNRPSVVTVTRTRAPWSIGS